MRPLWILLLAVPAVSAQPTALDWTERTQQLGLGKIIVQGAGLAIADVDADGDYDLILADSDPDRPAALWLENSDSAGFSARPLDLPNGRGVAVCAVPVATGAPPRIFAAGPDGLQTDGGAITGDFRRCAPAPPGEDGVPRLLALRRDALLTVDAVSLRILHEQPLAGCDARDALWLPGNGVLAACWAGPDRHFVGGEERGGLLGTAYDARGAWQRSLALVPGDADGDGLQDFVKLVDRDLPLLYRQAVDGGFDAEPATASPVSIGAALQADLDLDGDLDLALAEPARIALFRNTDGRGRFLPAGAIDTVHPVALAFADLDGDLRPELIARSADGAVRVFAISAPGAFLTLRLEPSGSAGAVGAEVTVEAGRSRQSRIVRQPQDLYFGLGEVSNVSRLRVVWPDGRSQLALGLSAGRGYLLREGTPPEPLPD